LDNTQTFFGRTIPTNATPETVLKINRPTFRTVIIPADANAGDVLQLQPIQMMPPRVAAAKIKDTGGWMHTNVQLKKDGIFVDHPKISVLVPNSLPPGVISSFKPSKMFTMMQCTTIKKIWAVYVQSNQNYKIMYPNIPICMTFPMAFGHLYGVGLICTLNPNTTCY
tara:strand:- start:505 stop:1005 length:501 start_codon:yes stop_codon:yes gene_type:complete